MGSVLVFVTSGDIFHRFRVRNALPLPTKDTAKFRTIAVPAACDRATLRRRGAGRTTVSNRGESVPKVASFQDAHYSTHSANSRRQRCP